MGVLWRLKGTGEDMSDMADTFRLMNEMKKERHRSWYKRNMEVIEASSLEYTSTNNGECLLFRNGAGLKVDFYPSTGRWKSSGRVYSGGAKAFLEWHRKQNQKS